MSVTSALRTRSSDRSPWAALNRSITFSIFAVTRTLTLVTFLMVHPGVAQVRIGFATPSDAVEPRDELVGQPLNPGYQLAAEPLRARNSLPTTLRLQELQPLLQTLPGLCRNREDRHAGSDR